MNSAIRLLEEKQQQYSKCLSCLFEERSTNHKTMKLLFDEYVEMSK